MDTSDKRSLLEQFTEHAEQRLQRIDKLLSKLEQDSSDSELLGELMSMFHNLAGAGGAFGFFSLSRYSRKGEALCEELLERRVAASEAELRTLRTLASLLPAYLLREKAEAARALQPLLRVTTQQRVPEVLVFDASEQVRTHLVKEVRASGLPAKAMASEADLMAAAQGSSGAVIANAEEVARNSFQLLKQLRQQPSGDKLVILVLGALTSFTEKVEAIRHGADAYFEHIDNLTPVLDRLQELLESRDQRVSRILVVDDDPDQVALLRAVLQTAGYQVHSCQDPRYFDKELSLAKPDLLLLDIVMPGIMGTDLARYVRQDDGHRSLPILMLSALAHDKLRAEAVRAGADMYLQKPVTPDVLLKAVAGCLDSARRRGTVTPIEVLFE